MASPRSLDLAPMRDLPWPTAAQVDEFVEHLCWAHSWYKHLPPAGDAEFVVFLAADAGSGYENHERVGLGWKTTDEYARRFGRLDYAWRLRGESAWSRDCKTPVEPTPALVDVAGFPLGPAVSSDGSAVDAIAALHGQRADVPPAYRALIELHAASAAAYDALSETERDAIVDSEDSMDEQQLVALRSPATQRYLDAERRVWEHYDALHDPEVAKIRAAIARLRAALSR